VHPTVWENSQEPHRDGFLGLCVGLTSRQGDLKNLGCPSPSTTNPQAQLGLVLCAAGSGASFVVRTAIVTRQPGSTPGEAFRLD
jgi:hypothetical protein